MLHVRGIARRVDVQEAWRLDDGSPKMVQSEFPHTAIPGRVPVGLKTRTERRQQMTDRDKLPTKTATGNAVVPTEQSGSLVRRGLDAVRNRQKQALPPYGGDAEAQFEFAEQYYEGYGASEGRAKSWAIHQAIKWWEMAAEQGYAPAQNRLGWAYSYGEGVPKDYVKAHMWLSLAWEANKVQRTVHYNTDFSSSSTDEQRDYIEGFMTPAEIAEAQRLARQWIESHAS